jgi:nitrate/TMAO reductase-like tetraheme cytochrome c subunit
VAKNWAISVIFKKQRKVNNHPICIGENSPNLVTLQTDGSKHQENIKVSIRSPCYDCRNISAEKMANICIGNLDSIYGFL